MIRNSVISSSSGTGTNDGIDSIASSGTYTLTINNSQITGGSNTISQDGHYTTRVATSQLAGGGAFGGTYVCVSSHSGSYAVLNGSCQ